MKPGKPVFLIGKFSITSLALVTALTVFLFVFMEWLFAVTRPSFFDYASFGQKVYAFLTGGSLITAACLVGLVPAAILHFFRGAESVRRFYGLVFLAIPAFFLACQTLLLVDNFTYTLFKFGIVSTTGFLRGLYAVVFIFMFLLLYRKAIDLAVFLEKCITNGKRQAAGRFLFLLAVFLAVWIATPFITFAAENSSNGLAKTQRKNVTKPDIVLITVDGLNAENLSLYGYKNDTTPFLRELAPESLVAENAFSNAQGTIGSLTSLLTGRYPADTRVLRSVDILEGQDSYQSLPAVLKSYGYYTAQLAYSYYADAYRVNFQQAFDSANGKAYEQSPIFSWLAFNLPTYSVYFLQEMYTRLTDRLGHIFFIQDMTDPYRRVTEMPEKINDAGKLKAALSLLESEDQPVFVHIHWLGTHGPKFYPAEQVFSEGVDIDSQGKFDPRLYDDSILEFDQSLAEFYGALQSSGMAENALLIIASDHSQKWTVARLPLLFHFPGASLSGNLHGNVENLDIAPTILDYMGVKQPGWMAGRSLLQPDVDDSPVFIAAIPKSSRNPDTGKVVYPDPEPPFYQFGRMSVVVCDSWYRLNLGSLEIEQGKVKEYQGDCENTGFNSSDALQEIINHLILYGFDTETLQKAAAGQP